jgi:palmitoyl-protein thioesterase
MLWLLFLSLLQFVNTTSTPVVLLHGIASDSGEMDDVETWLRDRIKVTAPIYKIEIGNGVMSSINLPMQTQVKYLCNIIYSIKELQDGFNIIGISQGGLLGRGYVEMCNIFPVKNLITWGTPHDGIFGFSMFPINFENIYSETDQSQYSFAGYWKDPDRYTTYLEKATFLPELNNEREHPHQEIYKDNILSLKNFVMVWSPIDGVIKPASSCKFEFFTAFINSDQYTHDLIGLRTLFESDRLKVYETSCMHMQYKSKCLDQLELFTVPFVS